MDTIVERHAAKVSGSLSCFDRVVMEGRLRDISYAAGMTRWLEQHGCAPAMFAEYFKQYSKAIHETAKRLAANAGARVEIVYSQYCRKEDLVAKELAKRGHHVGLVLVLAAQERCPTFRTWRNDDGTVRLRGHHGKCQHYYFYFIDEELGLCYLRVPTWAPFRLQFYFNGHRQLARKLERAGIGFIELDNAFIHIDNVERAQKLATDFDLKLLAQRLQHYAQLFGPSFPDMGTYTWAPMQVEFSTDIIFRRKSDLAPLYECITRTAVLAVKPEHVATFLGKRLSANFQGVLGNDFSTRIEGTRVKHYMGKAAIKMYDKGGIILRIETTANDPTVFRAKRTVRQRDGTKVFRVASLTKDIESLWHLQRLLGDANRRYLEFISAIDDTTKGAKELTSIARRTKTKKGRSHRGINFFDQDDLKVLLTIARGEIAISGFRNKNLRSQLPGKTSSWVSRCIARLRALGLLKPVARTYKYFVTALGKRTLAAGLTIQQMGVLPALSRRQRMKFVPV